MLSNFPNMQYYISEHGTYILLKDIYFKLKFFFEKVDKNKEYFNEYLISDGETPEDISLKKYRTREYWFLILLINKRVDPFYDWVLSNDEIMRYAEKFVTENPEEVKLYVSNNPLILKHYNEQYGTSYDEYSPVNPTDKNDSLVRLLIDTYYNIMSDENDKRRRIYLPSQSDMSKIYNNFLKEVNDF